MTEAIPAPGPAARVQRTAGQLGGVGILLTLVVEFDWLGAGNWTPEQATAVFAAAGVVASAAQNLAGHYRNTATKKEETAPIGAAPPSAAKPPRKP